MSPIFTCEIGFLGSQFPARRNREVVFADAIDGNVSGLGKVRHREFAMASGEMTRAEFTAFLSSAFANLITHSVDGSIHFVCMDWRHMDGLTLD
jgi:hypothetical protein